MSFVVAAPETMGAVAGDLAGIGSTLREATAVAAGQTTGITSAAADDVSLAISELFGTYGQQFQMISAHAAAFHSEFVSVLNGGAAAYLSTEMANAQQAMGGGVSGAAASTPLLGGLLGLGGSSGSGGLLGGLVGGGSGGGGLLGGFSSGLSQLLGGFNSIGTQFANGFGSQFFNPAILSAFPTLSDFTGPFNLGNLTPGLSLTSGPLGALLGPTLNGVGLDVGNFFSNELVNGITPTNVFGIVPGLVQDVPLLQGLLNSLLPGLFGPPPAGTVPYPNPYTVLGETTVYDLNAMGAQFVSHPFPILNQIVINQNHYAQIVASGIASDLQGFPANVPANIQLALQGASTFNPAAIGQDFVNGTTGFWGTVGTSLNKMGADLQLTIPTASNDMAMAGQAIQMGDYYGAVQDAAHAPIDLFITGFDTSQLAIGSNVVTVIPPDFQLTIAGPVGLEGPAAELLPILTAIGQQPVGLASLVPHGSIPGMMLGNFANAIDTLVNANVTANFAVNVGATLNPVGFGATLAGTAVFGLPLQLGFAILGPPFAMANGIAQGATAFGAAAQAGNVLGMLNAIGDMPAYAMNGFLNGQLIVDLPLPIAVSTPVLGTFVIPAVAHVPFDGLLTPPEPLTVTIPAGVAGITVPINSTLGGTEFGGLFPTLFNTIPEAIAASINNG
ncbi:PE family protein [Mycobacterium interjectum]|uniref:PE family protein n=1 Tax=Mycobacterium interjectum TaxID=33895 RepID=UPI0009FF080E|nr:PE family protein [Mycobacterium interjectum]